MTVLDLIITAVIGLVGIGAFTLAIVSGANDHDFRNN